MPAPAATRDQFPGPKPLTPASVSHAVTPGWDARLRLTFEPRGSGGRTVLARRAQHGPLAVQRAFYPEGDVAHVYVLHPPGGLVPGDALELSARLEPDAKALLTTPSAGKFYRSDGRRSRQVQAFSVGAGAVFEWLPQENIAFAGANTEMTTRVDLEATARFIGWEILCLGRPAAGERFDAGCLSQHFELLRDGRPMWLERGRLQAGAPMLDAVWGLNGHPVVGTLVATGGDDALIEALRSRLETGGAARVVVTRLDDVIVCRYLGQDAAQARDLFVQAWRLLRPPLLGREACPPRIWQT